MNGLVSNVDWSMVFRGLISLVVVATTAAIVINQREVPGEWWAIVGVVTAFYFNGANQANTARVVAQAVKNGKAG